MKTDEMTWEARIPLFGPAMRRQWFAAAIATAILALVVVGTPLAVLEGWRSLLQVSGVLILILAGMWALALLVAATVFRGRYCVRYTLTEEGLEIESVMGVAKTASRASVLLGFLSRSALLTGSGLITRTSETQSVSWRRVFRAEGDVYKHSISLYSEWRMIAVIQCTPQNYEKVMRFIGERVSEREQPGSDHDRQKSPLPSGLVLSAAVIASCIPLFAVAEEYTGDIFLPLLLLCFGLATVWLVGFFGWVVLATIALQAALLVAELMTERESYIWPERRYRVYEILDEGDWGALLVAGLGAAVLIWLSVRALRRRSSPVLLADHSPSDKR